MARKRTHEEAARSKLVSVRLREDTFNRVEEAAKAASLSRASYLEHLIENRAVKVEQVASAAMPVPLLNELKRIGNNLNQIAHNANCQIPPQEGALAKVLADIIAAMAANEVTRRGMKAAMGAAPAPSLTDDEIKALQKVKAVFLPDDDEPPPSAPAAIALPVPAEVQAVDEIIEPEIVERAAGNENKPPEPALPSWVRIVKPDPPTVVIPTGVPVRIYAHEGGYMVEDPSNIVVRVARYLWHHIRPPPEDKYTRAVQCPKYGTMNYLCTPKGERLSYDPKAASPWSVLQGRVYLRPPRS